VAISSTLQNNIYVFAQDDLDVGNFTELEYAFDTDTAKPVKQRMRRTSACFVDEEEAHPRRCYIP
jgi:hypothetical protein